MPVLVLFVSAFAAVALFDVRTMRKIGLQKELAIYVAMSAICVLLAARYFPQLHRRSIMSLLTEVLRIKW